MPSSPLTPLVNPPAPYPPGAPSMLSSPLTPLVNPPAPYPPGAPRACKPMSFSELQSKFNKLPIIQWKTSNPELESKIPANVLKKEVTRLKNDKDHQDEGIPKMTPLQAEKLLVNRERIAESARVLELQRSLRLQGTTILEQLESKIQQSLRKMDVAQQKTLKDEKIAELTRLLQLRAEKLLKKEVTQQKTLTAERIAELTRLSQLKTTQIQELESKIESFSKRQKEAAGKTTNSELKPTLLSQLQAKKIEKLESKIESNAQQETLLREEIMTLEANLQSKRNELKDREMRLEKRQQVEGWLIEAGEESNKRVSRLQNAVACSLRREKILRKDVTQQKALVAKLQGEKKIQAERIATLMCSSELQARAIRKLESKIESHDNQKSLLQKGIIRLQNEAASSLRQEERLKKDINELKSVVAGLEDAINLDAETIEGLKESLESAKEVYGAERDNLIRKIANLEARLAPEIPNEEEEMEFVQISMDDMDAAIDDGDWDAVVEVCRAFDQSNQNSSMAGSSKRMTPPEFVQISMDDMDAAIDDGDLDEGVEAAKAFNKGDQESSMAGSSEGMTPDKNDADIEDESYSESSYSVSDGSATTATTTTEDHRKLAEYRAQVEELVQVVLPDETEKVDAMMAQFKGREAELVSTLQTMEERSSNQRARAAIHKSKPPSQQQYSMGGTNSGDFDEDQDQFKGSEYSNEYDDRSYYSGENSQEGSGSFYSEEEESASRSYYSEEGSQERSFYSQEEGSQEGCCKSQE